MFRQVSYSLTIILDTLKTFISLQWENWFVSQQGCDGNDNRKVRHITNNVLNYPYWKSMKRRGHLRAIYEI